MALVARAARQRAYASGMRRSFALNERGYSVGRQLNLANIYRGPSKSPRSDHDHSFLGGNRHVCTRDSLAAVGHLNQSIPPIVRRLWHSRSSTTTRRSSLKSSWMSRHTPQTPQAETSRLQSRTLSATLVDSRM